jgi:hypothetical protein
MNKFFTILFAFAFASISFTSCDDCRGIFGKNKVECSNGGTCNAGLCDCLKGYTGTNCEILVPCELKDIVCVYGTCEDGTCICESGYEGDDCSGEIRAKFLGSWGVWESCEKLDTLGGYSISIERDLLDGNKMKIKNLFTYEHFPINGFFSPVVATGTPGTNEFKISNQKPDGNDKSITGTGLIEVIDGLNQTIKIDYVITNKSKEYTCSVTGQFIPNP